MKPLRWFLFGLALLATFARAETWQTGFGPLEGRLAGVYGPMVLLVSGSSTAVVSMESFGDSELGRVADFVGRQPPKGTPWKDARSPVAKALRRRLQVLEGDKLVPFNPGDRPEPEFYLVYFGAHWCPPCRAFSPDFVREYRRLQELAPGRFEVIFVSSDRDPVEMRQYVVEEKFPWPVVDYHDRGSVEIVERWAGRGIPCLVVLTRDGDAIYHSYHGEEYVGPRQVLREFEKLLRATLPSAASRRGQHRLAVVQHVRAAGASAPAKPYLIGLDLRKYHTLAVKELKAKLDIDPQGHVTNAAFEPKQSPVIDYQLVSDAGNWLFLPAVKDGKPVATTAMLPLQISR